jgi:spore maturation protein CgeB/ubiquinone/menaquinone biosynthesis C-methylase UbiE
MAAAPRILTFNFHEPYLCLMAKTGFRLFVGEYRDPPLARGWYVQYRPVPKNITFLREPVWQKEAMAGQFDVIIAHNETNALNILRVPCPKLLVCHNRRTFLNTTASVDEGNAVELFDRLLQRLQEEFSFIFISESKRADYGVPGKVILPGIDVEDYGGYTGAVPEVIRVGNMMRERDLMFDVDFQECVCDGIPNRVVGDNPAIPGSRPASSFGELLDTYRRMRCLLHVTREEWEDGYNLSMLEAMACGMPVVSLANRTSPLTDGKDGYLSYDAGVLRARLQELLGDLDGARAVGARGRETVARKFPMSAFVEKWREAIETAAEQSTRLQVRTSPRPAGPAKAPAGLTGIKILMHYLSSPLTTGRYFELAARKNHQVLTAGFRCPEAVLDLWGFTGALPEYPPHAIDIPLECTYKQLAERIPSDFKPDVYLWIDSGPKEVPSDIDVFRMPKVCYLIDTHIAPELRLAMARHFDYTFLAQKAQVEDFLRAGVRNVTWLPLACCPELHNIGPFERLYDVSFICNPQGDHNDRRRNIMRTLGKRFPNSKIGQFWPEEMARVYAQSRIVVNACVNRDVNMRVFEAMASGALLITDEADGLEDLFVDGTHLVIYRQDDNLYDLVESYLADETERERIAAAGRALVYEKHTYDLRLNDLLSMVLLGRGSAWGAEGSARYQLGGYFRLTRPEMMEHVPRGARRLLDVGCGGGDFGQAVKKRGKVEVVGIEIDPQACAMADQVLDRAIEGNIETMELPFEDGYFDCITFSDVLEHLIDPTEALRKVTRVLAPDGVILMSIPNVGYYEVIQMLANGRWRYSSAGIMDRSHLRFFTAAEIRQMITDAGLEMAGIGPLSIIPEEQAPLERDGTLSLYRVSIGPVDEEEYRNLRTYQFAAVAGKPGGDRLTKARQALDARQDEAAYALAQEAYGVDESERRHIMARAVVRLGKLDHAEELYREALRLKPDAVSLKGDLGVLYVAMNRLREARPYLEDAVQRDPENCRALGALGLVYFSEGDYERAFACLRRALEASFEHSGLVSHLIDAAHKLGRLDEVTDLVGRFADFYAGNCDLAYAYAVLLTQLGRVSEARSRLETGLLAAPGHTGARQLLGSLMKSG